MTYHEMDAEPISSYSRTEAIEDGVLVDVSEVARLAGFRFPVAVTQALWADIEAIPAQSGQDVQGRLWDVLWMGRRAIQLAPGGGRVLSYELIMPVGGAYCEGYLDDPASLYQVRLVCGPGDDEEPVITLMQPGED